MLDESQKAWKSAGVQVNIACSNRFSSLVDEDVYVGSEPNIGRKLVKSSKLGLLERLLLGILRDCVVSVNRRKVVRF